MSVVPIRLYGDPVLREKATEITRVNDSIIKLVADMLDTLKEAQGLGLAANQVGVLKRVFVVNLSHVKEGETPFAIMNPVLMDKAGEIIGEEGCLSIPGIYEDVLRAKKVTFKGLDIAGKEITIQAEDLLSRVMQHELDHLNGILFIDHLSKIKKEEIDFKLDKISEKSLESKRSFF
ncbi:MAG: peptide deformylase [candidate division Zixibacteria bacterium RBG_16_40_9]|nr:MAG: peptide deformylase [candidate division Zixibacteria bacterium RBG_16_40_9]